MFLKVLEVRLSIIIQSKSGLSCERQRNPPKGPAKMKHMASRSGQVGAILGFQKNRLERLSCGKKTFKAKLEKKHPRSCFCNACHIHNFCFFFSQRKQATSQYYLGRASLQLPDCLLRTQTLKTDHSLCPSRNTSGQTYRRRLYSGDQGSLTSVSKLGI